MFTAGRMIITYGCIEDDEPSWEGTPDHSIGKLCNTADEMALGQIWIHPALNEVVEVALLKLMEAFDEFDASNSPAG